MTYEQWVRHVYAHIRMFGIDRAKKALEKNNPKNAENILRDAINMLRKEFPKVDVETTFQ